MDIYEIQNFIEWYWKEIDGKPSSDSSLTIAEYYLEDMRKERNIRLFGMEEITKPVESAVDRQWKRIDSMV